ncbi:MAG: carbohydrate porin [Verrucomicrobia bacterium]|nr:carbohydrate porin [Verrucomicrobiota bacterium]
MNRLRPLKWTSLLLLVAAFSPLARGGDAPADAKEGASAFSFPTSYTGEGFANLSGDSKRGAIYEGLLSVGVQGDLEKGIGWKGGSFLVSGIDPHGSSLTDHYVHDLNRVSNIDAYDSVRLYEAWVQQELAESKVSIRLGQILADTEFFVSDNGALFLNGAFGAIPVVSQNCDAPVFPVAAPGMRVRWTATEPFSVQAGLYKGDVGDPATENTHGLDWSWRGGVLAITEVAYKIHSAKGSQGLPGVYKLGAFFHSSGTNEAFPEAPSHSNAGGYFVADQQLWRKLGSEGQGLSGFVRIGAAPADRNAVPFYLDTGLNFKGLIPGRDNDIAGLGLSYTNLSGKVCDDAGKPSNTHPETVLEATYKIALKEWFSVQPDFQYICNPGGTESASNAVVVGLRFHLTFP